MLRLLLLATSIYTSLAADPFIWPLPTQSTVSTSLDINLSTTFTFSTTSTSDILKQAITRYQDITFPHTPEQQPSNTVLSSLNIKVSSTSELLNIDTDESYTLTIQSTTATLSANTVFGALKGLETFSQLVIYNFTLGYYQTYSSSIIDKPRFKWRGILIDTSRHFLNIKGIKKLIEGMSYTKFNVLHWHIVDTQSFPYESKVYPKFSKGAFNNYLRYSQNDISYIVMFAKNYGIRVVPEFDIPGHTMSWCAGYPEICPNPACNSPNGESDSPDGILNPATNTTYDMLSGLFKELSTIFTDDYLHIGGDETQTSCWDNTTDIIQWKNENNYTDKDALLYFTQRALGIVNGLNKRSVQWDEIFTMFADNIKTSDVGAFQVWHDQSLIANIVNDGYYGIFSPNAYWYLDHLGTSWETMYKTEPCSEIKDSKLDTLVLGGEGCMWGETVDISDIEQTVFPRALAIAERLWSQRNVTDTKAATNRYAYMRCLLNDRGIAAAPYTVNGRGSPPGPGNCYLQR